MTKTDDCEQRIRTNQPDSNAMYNIKTENVKKYFKEISFAAA